MTYMPRSISWEIFWHTDIHSWLPRVRQESKNVEKFFCVRKRKDGGQPNNNWGSVFLVSLGKKKIILSLFPGRIGWTLFLQLTCKLGTNWQRSSLIVVRLVGVSLPAVGRFLSFQTDLALKGKSKLCVRTESQGRWPTHTSCIASLTIR